MLAQRAGLDLDTRKLDDNAYQFIPAPADEVLETLLNVEKFLYDEGIPQPPNFLDAGCGIGNVLLIALAAGYEPVSGVDLNPAAIETAKTLLSATAIGQYFKLDIGNILSYDKYNSFDVIYYYHPLGNRRLQIEFERKVEKECKKGGIIVAALKEDLAITKRHDFTHLPKLEASGLLKVFRKNA